MDYLALYWENRLLRKEILRLELELEAERKRSSDSVDLLMKGEALRERMMFDALTGKFPPKVT